VKIIDSDRYADAGIETLTFPGGEPHVKVPRMKEDVTLFLKLRSWADVGSAALVIDAFERQGRLRHTFIPYFPAARQDRTDGRAALSLAVNARLFGATPVCVFDPHSVKLLEHVKVARAYMPADLEVPIKPDVVGIIAPDEGARARAVHFRDRFYPEATVELATKHRDPQTGALSNYQLSALPRAGRYVIVDDICDGGGTFNLLADAFTRRAAELEGACALDLFVSHGIFSKGLGAIAPAIGSITTTDSWCRLPDDSRLRVLPLKPLVEALAKEKIKGEEHA
jgi:ribose-phosphate pyrophosphokinase